MTAFVIAIPLSANIFRHFSDRDDISCSNLLLMCVYKQEVTIIYVITCHKIGNSMLFNQLRYVVLVIAMSTEERIRSVASSQSGVTINYKPFNHKEKYERNRNDYWLKMRCHQT